MHIEIWSDYVCPFCYIGKRRLEMAMNELPFQKEVSVEYKSFELDRNAPKNSTQSIHEELAKKYGMSVAEAKKMNESVAEQARTVGLYFRFDNMRTTNTFDAHRLQKYASTVGKDITEKLLSAHFTEGKYLGDHQVLLDIAVLSGLDKEKVLEVLNDGEAFADLVRNDEYEASRFGISGVPFFLINRKYAISGAQPVETFKQALQKVWEEERKTAPIQSLVDENQGSVCDDNGCNIPPEKQ